MGRKKIESIMQRKGLEVDVDREAFAWELKTYRIRQGLTQAALGKEWGMSRYTIINAEAMRPLSMEMSYKLFARLTEAIRKEAQDEA